MQSRILENTSSCKIKSRIVIILVPNLIDTFHTFKFFRLWAWHFYITHSEVMKLLKHHPGSFLDTFADQFRGIYSPAALKSIKALLAAMAPNHQHKASKASFTKLKGTVNYKS